MPSVCALDNLKGFPNFDFKITFGLLFPSVVKGRPLIKTRFSNTRTLRLDLYQTCRFEFHIGSKNGTNLDAYLRTDLLLVKGALPKPLLL